MSEQTADLVARLRDRLRRTTRRITWAELAFGAVVAVGSLTGVWFVAAVLEASLWLGTAARTALAATIGATGIGVAAALLARPVGRLVGLLPERPDEEVARRVGEHHPSVADRLVNLLHLADGKRSHAPAPFVDQAVQDLADDLDDVSFEEVEDFGRARTALRLASLPVAGVLAFLLVAPSVFLGASERLLAPNTEFTPPAPFQLSVTPGPTEVVRGDSLQIVVRATGTVPETVTLERRNDPQDATERISLRPDSAGTARHTLPNVRRSFSYRVRAEPVRTKWHTVDVTTRPLVRELQLRVTPPRYTGRPTRSLDPNVGDVTALPGAQVSVSAALDGPEVDSATLVFDNGPNRSLELQDNTATGTFSVLREDTYRLRLETGSGTTNRDPIQYRTTLQSDAPPSVRFLRPDGPTDIEADLTQELRVKLNDDFGFSEAKLFYRLTEERFGAADSAFSSISLPLPDSDQLPRTLVHEWLLAQDSGLDPDPGDVIAYYVQAWDNDTVNGPKSGRTATQRLRMPSEAEQYNELGETQNEAEDQMEQLRQRSDSTRRQFDQLRDELRRTREADWQNQQQLEQLQRKQESVEQGADELSKKVQELNRQMKKGDLSSPETAQKFEELQRVVEELNSPDLQKALEKLQKAMQENDFQKMQKALEQTKQKQQSQQEQLERTLELFKQLKAQQKLEEMSRRAETLKEQQEAIREKTKERMEDSSSTDGETADSTRTAEEDADPPEPSSSSRDSSATSSPDDRPSSAESADADPSSDSTAARSESTAPSSDTTAASQDPSSKGNPEKQRPQIQSTDGANEDLAAEQERTAEQMRELMEKMKEAEQEMEDVQSAPKKKMKQLNKELQQRNLPKQMQQSSQQLRQNQLQDAQQNQQQMQQQLEQMQQQLSKMQNQMKGRQQSMNVAGLRSALENTLHLSKRQESLRQTVEALGTDGPTLRSHARTQKTLSDGLETVTDSLASIASSVPEMSRKVRETSGNALRAMETATTALDERNADTATGHQKTSMKHMNELALMLSDLLDKMQNQQGSGSGSSMQQMMQQLQQMSGKQQKLNKQIQQFLNNAQGERMSSEQAERRKELAKQQRQIKKQLEEMGVGSEAKEQILGDLEKIAEQMEQSSEQLDDGRPSRDLIERQQQILTRLLNAQKSLQTQGEKEERRGREADDEYERRRPDDLPSTDDTDALRRDLIRALEMGYSPDYEELIKRYFDLLEDTETDEP